MAKTIQSPQTAPPSSEPPTPQVTSAGVIVLQWLTYAFWGWLILGLIWLMSVILINAILGESVNDVVPYAIAASLVLLPLAFICDFFYRKREPIQKVGAAMVIMVVHAVLFAVLGIISLIVVVFTSLNVAINSTNDSDSQVVAIITAGFATLLYAAIFLRTLNPFKGKILPFIYGLGMLVLTVLLLILAIVGPVVQSVAARGDRLIEQYLPEVQVAVNDYIKDNDKLPESLRDVSLQTEEAKELINNNKVEYIKEDPESTLFLGRERTIHRYQLCVEYQQASRENGNRYNELGYFSYISTQNHGEGRQCYKLQDNRYGF